MALGEWMDCLESEKQCGEFEILYLKAGRFTGALEVVVYDRSVTLLLFLL
jgi:hypothetical protein